VPRGRSQTKRPVSQYFWSRESRYVLYAQDQGGDENVNIYAVNPADAKDTEHIPHARNLTDVKDVRVEVFDVPKSEPDVIFVGLNDHYKAWHDLYQLKISTGERTLVRQNKDRVGLWIFDNAGIRARLLASQPAGRCSAFLPLLIRNSGGCHWCRPSDNRVLWR
jgi:desulfoferrodoxin (superoxide reductase-like protein)